MEIQDRLMTGNRYKIDDIASILSLAQWEKIKPLANPLRGWLFLLSLWGEYREIVQLIQKFSKQDGTTV